MARYRASGIVRRVGGRKRSRVRVRALVFFVFAALVITATLCGLAVNRHIEEAWRVHQTWQEDRGR